MGWSFRVFLVEPDDSLIRIPNAVYERMYDNPADHPLPQYSGRQVRIAMAVVELRDRRPVRVAHITTELWRFDANGLLDVESLRRMPAAIMDELMRGLARRDDNSNVIDRRERFFLRGMRWKLSTSLERKIEQAALGSLVTPALRSPKG